MKKRIVQIFIIVMLISSLSLSVEAKNNDKSKIIFSDNFDENNLNSWFVNSSGNADAIFDNGAMRLRVFRCSNVYASQDLGNVNGNITLDFDYTILNEGWGEGTIWKIFVDDVEVAGNGYGFWPYPYATSGGHVTQSLDIKGKTKLQYSLEQSTWCNNGDHWNTYYWIDNVTINKKIGNNK